MKILFMTIVILASLYLLLPEKMTNNLLAKFDQQLPQHKNKNAAEQLLAQVDNKLKNLESTLSAEQSIKIKTLEDEILALKKVQELSINANKKLVTKVDTLNASTKQEQYASNIQLDDYQTTENFKENKQKVVVTKKSNLMKEESVAKQTAQSIPNDKTTEDEKKWQRQRQARLQDIAQRMNEASLQALAL